MSKLKELIERRAQLRVRLNHDRTDLESAQGVERGLRAQKMRGNSISETELKTQTQSAERLAERVSSIEGELATLDLAIEQEAQAELQRAAAQDETDAEKDAAERKALAAEAAEHLAKLGACMAKHGSAALVGDHAGNSRVWLRNLLGCIGQCTHGGGSEFVDFEKLERLIEELRGDAWVAKAQHFPARQQAREQRARTVNAGVAALVGQAVGQAE